MSDLESMKRFLDEKDMNPSNYDIHLNVTQIPANIKKENIAELTHRLQKLMPLSKKVHLILNDSVPRELVKKNTFDIKCSLKIQNKRVEIK